MLATTLLMRVVVDILLVERCIVTGFAFRDFVLGQRPLVIFQEGGEGVCDSVITMA
jgi:hypothetical protein